MDAKRTVSVVIAGRVQGVSYRAWTRTEALALGLSGSVRNRDDGGVEAVFHGPASLVDRMVTLCRAGPPGARVADISVTDLGVTRGGDLPSGTGFEILKG